MNQPKTFFVIVKYYEALDSSLPIEVISSNPDKVKVRTSPVFLKKFTEDEKVGKTTFTVESSKVGAEAHIEAHYGSYNNSVHVKVIEQPPPLELPEGLSFEKPLYHVRINKEKTLTLWLKKSTKLDNPIIADIYSDHPEVVVKGGGRCELLATDVPRVLKGEIKVLGRQLNAEGTLTARVNGFEQAQTRVIVRELEPGGKFDFRPVEDDFGKVRYKWDIKNPYLLLIGAKNPSIRKYLGEPTGPEQKYPRINSELYHAVLAEVIAEALAFNLLEKHFIRDGQERRLDYDSANKYYHTHLTDFLIIAHKHLIKE